MMIDSMHSNYAVPLVRAFKQAPWRTQTQAVAAVSITLLVIAVVGGFYLTVAARAATAGRDLQSLQVRKTELAQNNDELRAELSRLRSIDRLATRALAMGFVPAQPGQIEYIRVDDYPYTAQTTPPPRAVIPPAAPQPPLLAVVDWLSQALQGLVMGGGRGG